jgi:hypothetical protein
MAPAELQLWGQVLGLWLVRRARYLLLNQSKACNRISTKTRRHRAALQNLAMDAQAVAITQPQKKKKRRERRGTEKIFVSAPSAFFFYAINTGGD